MSPDDFAHEPRSGNTYLHKLNSDLNHKKIKTKLNLIFLFVPSQLFVPLHGAQNHSHKAKTQTHGISTHFLNATAKLFINFNSLPKIS